MRHTRASILQLPHPSLGLATPTTLPALCPVTESQVAVQYPSNQSGLPFFQSIRWHHYASFCLATGAYLDATDEPPERAKLGTPAPESTA
jgi:hypothetical protein